MKDGSTATSAALVPKGSCCFMSSDFWPVASVQHEVFLIVATSTAPFLTYAFKLTNSHGAWSTLCSKLLKLASLWKNYVRGIVSWVFSLLMSSVYCIIGTIFDLQFSIAAMFYNMFMIVFLTGLRHLQVGCHHKRSLELFFLT